MVYTLLILLLAGIASFGIPFTRNRIWCYLYTGLALFCFAVFFCHLSVISAGYTINEHFAWLPQVGVNLDLHLDGLSLLFALLICGIGAGVTFYSGFYLREDTQLNRYFAYLFLFMFAMLGTVLSSNLISLFIFWELTSITSYLLISFQHHKSSSRRAALQGLLVTVFGGFGLLLAAILLHSIVGSYHLSTLLRAHKILLESHFYMAIVLLLLLAAFTKSAQWPFHFWLPNAMEAPTPVSAYLHSATMVKLGVYLAARFTPVLGGTSLWQGLLIVVSSITLVAAMVLMLRSTDLKRLLAYSTVMALAMLFFLIGGASEASVIAAMAFLLAHALYKGCLFLCAGNIDHSAGTRDIRELSGLLKQIPGTFIALVIAAASMAGLPMVLGFVVKELVYEAQLMHSPSWILTIIVVLSNVVFVGLAFLLVIKPFFGKQQQTLGKHRDHWGLIAVPLILSALSLIFGIYPGLLEAKLIAPAASVILNSPTAVALKVWHGVTPALMLSVITVVLGLLVYWVWPKLMRRLQSRLQLQHFGPEACFHWLLNAINTFANKVTRNVQSGRLRNYISVVFLFASLLVIVTFFIFNGITLKNVLPNAAHWFDWALVIVMITSALATLVMAPYLASLAMLSVVGFCATLIFLVYSAPDVAMTQLLVDVMTIVIVVLALYRLPKLPKLQKISKKAMWRNIIIAVLSGAMVTLLMLACVNIPFDRFVSEFYLAKSLVLAHGRNVVNVILVDFRAFDTLGEVVVVAIAGLGVYGLLHYHINKDEEE